MKLSLVPIAKELEGILGSEIELLTEIQAPETKLAMLENIRFWKEEEEDSPEFAQRFASFGQIYVNDCFSTSHHGGATMLFLPKFLPSFAGLALQKEVTELSKLLTKPERPLVAILAGAKLETKLPAIKAMSRLADKVLVAGKLMFEFQEKIENVLVAHDDVDGADIGPDSIAAFEQEIRIAKTIVWNGTMGKYEDDRYLIGTQKIAEAVVSSGAYTIVGGGDTVAVLHQLGFLDKITPVSLGGGAMLDFLAGKRLDGLASIGFYD
jgi:phosphoglycerate kinase